jgi:hypothetical protein
MLSVAMIAPFSANLRRGSGGGLSEQVKRSEIAARLPHRGQNCIGQGRLRRMGWFEQADHKKRIQAVTEDSPGGFEVRLRRSGRTIPRAKPF